MDQIDEFLNILSGPKDLDFGSDRFHPTKVVVNDPFSFCIPTIIKCAPVYKKDIQLGLFKYVKSSVLRKELIVGNLNLKWKSIYKRK